MGFPSAPVQCVHRPSTPGSDPSRSSQLSTMHVRWRPGRYMLVSVDCGWRIWPWLYQLVQVKPNPMRAWDDPRPFPCFNPLSIHPFNPSQPLHPPQCMSITPSIPSSSPLKPLRPTLQFPFNDIFNHLQPIPITLIPFQPPSPLFILLLQSPSTSPSIHSNPFNSIQSPNHS